ncbi:hypothetical protein [Rhizobium leguminosarum]|uniref:hypothetical protein n=1 Tax=Rhizobium leguminosarum TaxID=384 RepID=UPI0013EEA2ED|nr:hypothetical protein [Rhizobium leguminosarum]MBY2994937.1 hypothetical protein [Rhizobium leguminosarum]MBY3059708.1 hypothetical protein [Rhizobium leguminosarum]
MLAAFPEATPNIRTSSWPLPQRKSHTTLAPPPILTGFPSAMATAWWSGSAGVVLRKWDVVPPAAQTIIDVQIEKIQKMSKWVEASKR